MWKSKGIYLHLIVHLARGFAYSVQIERGFGQRKCYLNMNRAYLAVICVREYGKVAVYMIV